MVNDTTERLDRLESLLKGLISSVYQGQTDPIITTDLGLGLSELEMDDSTSTSSTAAVDNVRQPQAAS